MDYVEKLRLAKEALDSGSYDKETIKYIFPELAESEDEKMLAMAIKAVRAPEAQSCIKSWGINPDDVIAWLEKQGEHTDIPADAVLDSNKDGLIADTIQSKPKFKVGDWVVFNGLTLNIKEVIKEYYRTISYDCIPNSYDWNIDNAARLWTIQDAKDGDVLNSVRVKATIIFKGWNPDGKHLDAYCALQKGILIKQEMLWDRDFEPATKEQRDLLFQKMKENDYEWDAEKKELKKIEHSAWSEEDDQYLLVCKNALAKYQVSDKWDATIISRWLEDKLKSLRLQSTWKPSEEQMNGLKEAIEFLGCTKTRREQLQSLYEQLKKLRKE